MSWSVVTLVVCIAPGAGAAIVILISVAVFLRSDVKDPVTADDHEHEHEQVTRQIFVCLKEDRHDQQHSHRQLTDQLLRRTSR